MSSRKLLIVGTGITGAISANLIKSAMNDVFIIMWDKAMKTGGRMNTTKSPFHPTCTVDLGAQYITRYAEFAQSHERFYEELLEASVLRPLNATIEGMREMQPGVLNYVAPKGISSIVQHFLQKTDKDENLKTKMESVVYTSRYALALFYNKHLEFFDSLRWSAKYFSDSDIVFIAIDNKKRGTNNLPSVLVHTSCSFGAQNLESSKDLVQEKIMAALQQHLPDFPTPDSIRCHRWRYSQVQCPYPDNQECLVLHTSPFLICGGDSFVNSGFDGCIQASKNAAREIVKYFT